MSEKKLLPCPFCGGEAETCKNFEGLWYVWCKKCWCKTTTNTSEKFAIVRWNTRVPMQKIVERLEEEVNSWGKVYNVIKNRGYIDDYTVGAYDGYRNSVTIVKKEGGLNE
jgi:hypothetical protein